MFSGQLFDNIYVLTAPIPALLRVTLRILVGHHAALRFQDGRADEILAGNQLDVLLLTPALVFNRGSHRRIHVAQPQGRWSDVRLNLVDAPFVPSAALELCFEKRVHDALGRFRRCGFAGQAQDVGIVVLPGDD